jgi:hypothetical protein
MSTPASGKDEGVFGVRFQMDVPHWGGGGKVMTGLDHAGSWSQPAATFKPGRGAATRPCLATFSTNKTTYDASTC